MIEKYGWSRRRRWRNWCGVEEELPRFGHLKECELPVDFCYLIAAFYCN